MCDILMSCSIYTPDRRVITVETIDLLRRLITRWNVVYCTNVAIIVWEPSFWRPPAGPISGSAVWDYREVWGSGTMERLKYLIFHRFYKCLHIWAAILTSRDSLDGTGLWSGPARCTKLWVWRHRATSRITHRTTFALFTWTLASVSSRPLASSSLVRTSG